MDVVVVVEPRVGEHVGERGWRRDNDDKEGRSRRLRPSSFVLTSSLSGVGKDLGSGRLGVRQRQRRRSSGWRGINDDGEGRLLSSSPSSSSSLSVDLGGRVAGGRTATKRRGWQGDDRASRQASPPPLSSPKKLVEGLRRLQRRQPPSAPHRSRRRTAGEWWQACCSVALLRRQWQGGGERERE